MPKTSTKRLYFIPILSKALDVLEVLQKSERPMSLEAIYQRTHISKTTVYRILKEANLVCPWRRRARRKKAREEQERARKLISKELFEPLVREGVIPEWVVPNKYSQTQRYLDAAYKRYKQTLEEKRQEKISGLAKTRMMTATTAMMMVSRFISQAAISQAL